MTDTQKYTTMRDAGASPAEVCRSADTDGVRPIDQIRLLVNLFGLSLIDAKAVQVFVWSGMTLDAHQAGLARDLATLPLDTIEGLDDTNDRTDE